MAADSSNPERAFFTKIDAPKDKVVVHFNPNSLQYTITNTLKKEGQGSKATQHVSESTGKLTLDLVFDTTDTGADVRTHTEKIAGFMKPNAKKAPPVVKFEWGTFIFKGIIENYKETIDFFAPVGVPLRASINLTMSSQDAVFELEKSKNAPKVDKPGGFSPDAIVAPSQSPAGAAARGGDPAAARALGAANSMDSLRFSAGAALTVDASIKLGGPVAFASGGAGIGIGGGIGIGAGAGIGIGGGIGIGAGAGIGASAGFGASAGASFGASAGAGFGASAGASFGASAGAGFGASAGASFGASAGFSASAGVSSSGFSASSSSLSFGGSASAGIPATQGAFAGLRVSTSSSRTSNLDTSKLLQASASVGVATDSGATFAVGGQAKIEGSASLSADVGASGSLKGKITFD